jgi:hypothetical protein
VVRNGVGKSSENIQSFDVMFRSALAGLSK